MIRKQEGMVEILGEMRKGRRERIEKGSREGIEKDNLKNVAIVSSSPQGMTSLSSSIKIWFLQAYRMHS